MFKRILQGAALAAILACSAQAQPAAPTAAPRMPTASDFGRLPAIDSVSISPDGKYIAALTTPDGVTAFISVWSTAAMNQKPYIINPINLEGFRFFRVAFVKNDRLLVTFRELLKGQGGGANGSKGQDFFFHTILMSPTANGRPPAEILPPQPGANVGGSSNDRPSTVRLVSTLPTDPNNIIVQDFRTDGTIYKVNVNTAAASPIQRGSDKYQYYLDPQGQPRGRERQSGDGAALRASDEFKNPKTGAWDEAFGWFAKSREMISFAAFDDDPNHVLAISQEGHDKAVIASYDIADHKPPEVAFAHPFFDATGVVTSDRSKDYGHVLGFTYGADEERTYWTDQEFEALEQSLRRAVGVTMDSIDWTDPATGKHGKIDTVHDFDIQLLAYSDDLNQIIIEKSGPRLPPEYYLLSDKKTLRLLGKAFPQIDPAALGETRLVQFAARDGLMIPAFVTTPPKAIYGNGPYPTIVTPHGGPWARDFLTWDTTGWTQYFAARGYVVIEPQYRGSDGWGQKLWRAGDREWGGKMEDDMDDSAKWLVAQGIADPHRIAMHGYSYGGYAALDTAVRPTGIYRCVIAGAGLAEIARFQDRMSQGFINQYQRPTVEGVSPIQHIDQVSVPVLAYHGDSDQNVPLSESQRFTDALKAAGKPYKFVELPDMGHEIIRWSPLNKRDVLLTVDDFLKTSCAMGGK